MAKLHVAPYGAWQSPITADLIASKTIALGAISLDGPDTYWQEARPTEGGRQVLVRRTPDGQLNDLTSTPFNVRTRVHEYGGGAYLVHEGVTYFANFADQRLYRLAHGETQPLTPAVDLRYADAIIDSRRGRLIAIREDHTQGGPQAINTLVSLGMNGDDSGGRVLVEGADFYSSPRLNPDGSRLAWLSWNHPNMPWDGTELWVADVTNDGSLANPILVAGGPAESIFQPEWSPDGHLYFISDRTDWWNLYRWRAGQSEPLCPMAAEFGQPQWVFGQSTYAFTPDGRILCAYNQNGISYLALLDTDSGRLQPIELPYTQIGQVRASDGRAVFAAASATIEPLIVELDLATHQATILRRASQLDLDPGYLSVPTPIEFPTENNLTAHALYYRPHNRDYAGPEDERPPLLVLSHGGPTSATTASFNPGIQFWTSRGFAVVDVNYGGSTGYGRQYRQRLNGHWGIVDVDDCANAARYLIEQGEVDGRRLAIRGGSAGGYTTLAALTFRQVFKAGASYYGISDLEAMARETHKFESRYLDNLIGPYPARRDLYLARSPIHHTHLLATPMILLQGLEDKVVPPNQSEMMVEALRAKKLPVAYLPFAGEQHGFRRAETIQRALEAELYFYSRIFGFEAAGSIEPVEIENLPDYEFTSDE